jgi:hypothetical protein
MHATFVRTALTVLAGFILAGMASACTSPAHTTQPATVRVAQWDSAGWVNVGNGHVFRTGLTSTGRQVEVTCAVSRGKRSGCTSVVDHS